MTLRLSYEERQARDAYRKSVRDRRAPKADRVKKLAGPTRDQVIVPPRIKVSDAQKARVHAANKGKCWVCGADVPVSGPNVQYDHVIERALTGRDDDDALAPICTTPCHAQKTAKFLTTVAHVKRMGAKHRGETKPKRKIPSQGFSGDYVPFGKSRGFR